MANIKQITVNGQTYDIRDDSKLSTSLKGTANGLAELDGEGHVKKEQLPASFANLYDTTANWNAKPTFIPDTGQIVIYTDRGTIDDGEGGTKNVPGIKIGDGLAYCIDLPFISDDLAKTIIDHIVDVSAHVTEEERLAWNDKVGVSLTGEVLQFYK